MMDTTTPDLDIEPSNEQIDTPEELKERQRIQDVMSSRRAARNCFIEVTDIEVNARKHGHTPFEADELASRYVYRTVTAYVEEMAYHLRTTDAGQRYWLDLSLGQFTPHKRQTVGKAKTDFFGNQLGDDRPTPPALRDDPDPVTVVGLAEYLEMGEDHTRTAKVPGDGPTFYEETTVKTPVPVPISRRAFRATNHFVEQLLGLEMTSSKSTIGNVSLSSDGSAVNTNE